MTLSPLLADWWPQPTGGDAPTVILTAALFGVEWLLRLGLSLRVISKRTNVSEALAWTGLILLFPIVGAVIYVMLGEVLTGRRRSVIYSDVFPKLSWWLQDVHPRAVRNWSRDQEEERALSRLVTKVAGLPALPGNEMDLMDDANLVIQRLVSDVGGAQRSCYLEFYIWEEGGVTDLLIEALIEAAARGIDCRVLVDHIGSLRFLRGETVIRLRENGVRVQAALPVGYFRFLFRRFDVRLHRKIVVIDETISYVGSQNMADPKLFRKSAGVGQWVDAMIRLEGEASEALLGVFLADWQVETSEGIELLQRAIATQSTTVEGPAIVQVISTGPAVNQHAAKQIVVNAVYSAKRQLILTTPYYVPDESLQMALISAAQRGVDVTLIVPEKVDSRLVHWASRPYQKELIRAGVRVMDYEAGMLHTKSITIDDGISLFGSLNLDLRSFHLNYEITLATYDRPFTSRLRRLQQSYMSRAQVRKLAGKRENFFVRTTENIIRLMAPLL